MWLGDHLVGWVARFRYTQELPIERSGREAIVGKGVYQLLFFFRGVCLSYTHGNMFQNLGTGTGSERKGRQMVILWG